MSYCRFSSLNWGCDLLVFDGATGITILVATHRYFSDTPCPPMDPLPAGDDPDFAKKVTSTMMAAYDAQKEWVAKARPVLIGLPYDGAEYHGLDREEAAEVLANLMAAGYRMPHYLIENVMVPE